MCHGWYPLVPDGSTQLPTLSIHVGARWSEPPTRRDRVLTKLVHGGIG